MITFYWIITILFFISSFHILQVSIEQTYLYIKSRKKDKNNINPVFDIATLPFVTIQLPLYNEKYVVERLLENAFKIDYPKDKLEIQILDDSTDNTSDLIKIYLQANKPSGLIVSHIQRKKRTGFKGGALKEALQIAQGDLISVFDADFIIPPDFLLNLVHEFADENLAAVQTRWGHLNEDHSMLTRIQGLLINNHFLVEQFGRYKAGWMVQFSGTAGIWRKTAIIDSGGWQSDTLIEDVDLSIRAQLKGWKIKIRPDIVCKAELPDNLNGLKVQQFRWMQGGAEVTRKHLKALWKSNFSLSKKYHGTLHLATGFLFPSLLLMCISSIPMIYAIPILNIPIELLAVFTLTILFNAIPLFAVNVGIAWKNRPFTERIRCFLSGFTAMILIGPGIALHNSIGIFKGLMRIYTPFQRTPKSNTDIGVKLSPSKLNFNALGIAELTLSMFFLLAIIVGFLANNLVFVVFHFFLFFAYLLVASLSFFKPGY